MKTNHIIFLLFSVFTLSACSDFLDTMSESKQTDEATFAKTSFTEAAIMGIYSSLMDSYVYGQKITTNWAPNSDIESSGFQTTDANLRNPSSDNGPANFYCSPDNRNVNWSSLFRAAELASTAVDGIRQSPAMLTPDSAQMKVYLGEALTLKSLVYFELVKFFGDIPYKRNAANSDLSNVYIGKADRDTVYKYIVNDLIEAQAYLPWLKDPLNKYSYSNPERITKGFAKGLCARVALFAGGWSIRDRNQFPETTCEVHPTISEENGYFTGRTQDWRRYYEIAIRECAELLGNKENPHSLDPNYENIWKTVNGGGYNQFNENLFEIAFGTGQNGDIGATMGQVVASGCPFAPRGFGGSYVSTHAYYFYSFDRDDLRRDIACINISIDNTGTEKFETDPLGSWKMGKWRYEWTSDALKALIKTATSGRVSTGINWIVMRYSDVYLMFAEAQNALYGKSMENPLCQLSAAAALEIVRARAFSNNMAKVSAYDADFQNAIINERAWEFGGEALRKFDLARWGKLHECMENMKEALCLMFQGNTPFSIFGRQFDGSEIPSTISYRFCTDDAKKIDRSTITYFSADPQQGGAITTNWISEAAKSGTNMRDWCTKVIVFGTGLNKSYDYSWLYSQLTIGTELDENIRMNFPKVGNSVCNNRHPFAIYNVNILNSNGNLKNSYGY